jgi:hypothetical protein
MSDVGSSWANTASSLRHSTSSLRHTASMDEQPRTDLPYAPADVATATQRLRAICITLPEVTERLSHGSVTFFVRGRRTLCYLSDDHHGDGRLALVYPAPDGVQAELLRCEPERFFRPPYVGHRGWLGLRLDIDPDWDEVEDVVQEAYRLVAPKTLVRRLDDG